MGSILAVLCYFQWLSYILGALRLGISVFVLFTSIGPFFVVILSPCHSLEVLIILRVGDLQSIRGRAGGSSGLESSQDPLPSSQTLWTGQASDWAFGGLSGELEWELPPSRSSRRWIVDTLCSPAKFLGSQLCGGTADGRTIPGQRLVWRNKKSSKTGW